MATAKKKPAAKKPPPRPAPAKAKSATQAKQKAGTSKEAAEQRKRLFVEAYISNGGNGKRAAIAAGFSPKAAAQQASRLLTDANVSQLVRSRSQKLAEKMELTTERTLREVARLAYFDPRKLLDENGNQKRLQDLDDDTAAAIAGLEIEDKLNPVDAGAKGRTTSLVFKYKIGDKNSALDKAMRHLGLFKEDNKQKTLLDGVDRETLLAIRERLSGGKA